MTVPSRFGVLRLIAVVIKILAWIQLVFAVLLALGASFLEPLVRQSALFTDATAQLALVEGAGIVAGIALLFGGIVGFLTLYATGEAIQMQLAMEENTRLTAALLLRLDQEGRSADSPQSANNYGDKGHTYYGEVVE